MAGIQSPSLSGGAAGKLPLLKYITVSQCLCKQGMTKVICVCDPEKVRVGPRSSVCETLRKSGHDQGHMCDNPEKVRVGPRITPHHCRGGEEFGEGLQCLGKNSPTMRQAGHPGRVCHQGLVRLLSWSTYAGPGYV